MSDQMVLQDWLDTLSKVTTQVGSVAPAPVGSIFRIVGIALESAAAIAKSGRDPVAEIERIHSADPLVASVKDEWRRELDRKFGGQ